MSEKRKRTELTPAVPATGVCIKVPKPNDAQRAKYNALSSDPAEQRCAWYRAECDHYVGRPKCDGGWYHVPEVKKGSIWANPYTLKEYSLKDSLKLYVEYLQARFSGERSVEDLIALFPGTVQPLLTRRFVDGKITTAKSVAHYELSVGGAALRQRAIELHGCKLGCWCDDPTNGCHAGVLAEVVNQLADSESVAAGAQLAASAQSSSLIVDLLKAMSALPVSIRVLRETRAGQVVSHAAKCSNSVCQSTATELSAMWEAQVIAEIDEHVSVCCTESDKMLRSLTLKLETALGEAHSNKRSATITTKLKAPHKLELKAVCEDTEKGVPK